eukprot:m.28371 g.28371  ORF g.28371 m.28371 type:complete len:337 (+) comp30734_c0_seq3:387-1397(+)
MANTTSTLPPTETGTRPTKLLILILVPSFGGLLVILLVVLIALCCYRRRRRRGLDTSGKTERGQSTRKMKTLPRSDNEIAVAESEYACAERKPRWSFHFGRKKKAPREGNIPLPAVPSGTPKKEACYVDANGCKTDLPPEKRPKKPEREHRYLDLVDGPRVDGNVEECMYDEFDDPDKGNASNRRGCMNEEEKCKGVSAGNKIYEGGTYINATNGELVEEEKYEDVVEWTSAEKKATGDGEYQNSNVEKGGVCKDEEEEFYQNAGSSQEKLDKGHSLNNGMLEEEERYEDIVEWKSTGTKEAGDQNLKLKPEEEEFYQNTGSSQELVEEDIYENCS